MLLVVISLLLALAVLVVFGLAAWGVDHFGSKYDDPRKCRRLALGMAGLGLVFSIWAFFADFDLRRTTLLEVLAVGSEGVADGDPAPVREMTFAVEHPEVEHSLLVAPLATPLRAAGGPVEILVRLAGPDDVMLIEESRVFEVRYESVGSQPSAPRRAVWSDWNARFTPKATGPHRLELTLLTPGIPEVHVRIGDPLKTDGERAPGY